MDKDIWHDVNKHPFPKNGVVFVVAVTAYGGKGYTIWPAFFEYIKDEVNKYQLFDIGGDCWLEDYLFETDSVTHWKILGTPNA